MTRPFVSVLINNYNYGRFLREAIDSALAQSYSPMEVILVDDGSTDNSRAIAASYDSRLTPILKPNRGQASASNVGVAASRGEILCVLDSDDYFYPQKVERIVETFSRLDSSQPIMVHHSLRTYQPDGTGEERQSFGRTRATPLNLAEYARKYRFMYYAAGVTSGIALNRRMADRLFPLPEKSVRLSADELAVRGASLVGELYCHAEHLGVYRVHGANQRFSSARRMSTEYVEALDADLNQELTENNLTGKISYEESM